MWGGAPAAARLFSCEAAKREFCWDKVKRSGATLASLLPSAPDQLSPLFRHTNAGRKPFTRAQSGKWGGAAPPSDPALAPLRISIGECNLVRGQGDQ